MKVALFVHCFFPTHFYGTETYTLELARNLLELGHEPVVVSAIFPGESPAHELVSYYEYQGIPVYCFDKNKLPNTRVKDTYYQPEMRAVHKELLLKMRPDIVHVTHLINHTAVLLETASELKMPTVATMTDFFGFCFNNKLEAADGSLCRGPNKRRTNCLRCYVKAVGQSGEANRTQRFIATNPCSCLAALGLYSISRTPGFGDGRIAGLVLDVTRRPDILGTCYEKYGAAITPTRFMRDAYVANGLKVPIREIRFGVDLPRVQKAPRDPEVAIALGFIGQIAPHKGPDLLIDAFRRLARGTASLEIFGSEDQDPEYMNQLRNMALGHNVRFNGTFPRERMPEILSRLDFLVIPSRWYENSPLVLLDSLATHTPVVVSDVEGMTEFVVDGDNGFIFRRGDVVDLTRVLQSIVRDPVRSRRMTGSTEYARTTRVMTEDVLSVYESVVQKGHSS